MAARLSRPRSGAVAVAILAGVLLSGCEVLPQLGPSLPPEASSAAPVPSTGPATTAVAGATPTAASSAANTSVGVPDATLRRWESSVVRVRSITCNGVAVGSGFVVDAHTIVTNRHVVKGETSVQVDTADGGVVAVKDVRQAKDTDLAVIHTDTPLPAPLPMGKDLFVGVRVAAIGYPLGDQVVTTEGVVEGWYADTELGAGVAFQTSAHVDHGNSGGPVLDSLGTVRGVVYAKSSDGESSGIGVTILQSLLKDPEGFLGAPHC